MTSVIVLGASGYVGFGVANALRQAGHRVYGVVRTDTAAKLLKSHEIVPVLADVSNPAGIISQSFFPSVTHIIDSAAASYQVLTQFVDAVSEAAQKTPHRKLSYIYTSGVLIYGKQEEDAILTESHPIVPFAPNAASQLARKALEDKILQNPVVRGTVVRPGWVYGGNGGRYLDHLWSYDGSTGDYSISGSATRRWSWIHISDLSSAYLHLVNAPQSVISGEIFNIADSTRATWGEIKLCAVKAAINVDNDNEKRKLEVGKVILKAAETDGFSQAADLSIVVSAEKLKRIFGWNPKFNFLEAAQIYFSAWKAAKEQKHPAHTATASAASAGSH